MGFFNIENWSVREYQYLKKQKLETDFGFFLVVFVPCYLWNGLIKLTENWFAACIHPAQSSNILNSFKIYKYFVSSLTAQNVVDYGLGLKNFQTFQNKLCSHLHYTLMVYREKFQAEHKITEIAQIVCLHKYNSSITNWSSPENIVYTVTHFLHIVYTP